MLAHNVYFTLKDTSPAARAKLIQACKHYLTGHPGTVFYACGTLEDGLRRPVNDLGFNVALHVIFTDRASHDAYQEAARHQQFIAENRDNWMQVRVFDSTVQQE